MNVTKVDHRSVEERRANGEESRERTPPSSHGEWVAGADRFDPIALLEQQNETREPDLVPVRHGRMMVSPFTFYRGAAKIMAADLEYTPRAGLTVQLCGDAHLSNFGAFASPERQLLFDLNDFDETLPGPFEYDVKRLAASFTIAALNNGFGKGDARDVTLAAVRGYRETMAEFAEMSTMDVWYAHLSEATLLEAIERLRAASTDTAEKKGSSKKKKKKKKKRRLRRRRRRRAHWRLTPSGRGRPRRKLARATACRRCRSSPRSWTASTGSSASHRPSSRCVTWKTVTASPSSSSST